MAFTWVTLGEAVRNIPEEVQALYPQVPWKAMRGMRNFLVHEYPWINPRLVWKTAQTDIPSLVPLLEAILEGVNGSG